MRALALPLLLAACVAAAPPPQAGILAIGDSVMAWNGGNGIPETVAATLGRPVTDASRSGAHLTHPNAVAAALGFDVSRQARGGEGWDWVILTGGGNDLRGVCATPGERPILDGIVDEWLTGDLPALVGRLRAGGAKVAYVGYYDPSTAGVTAFTPCARAFDRINARMARLAARDPGFVFVDAGEVIDRTDRGLYADDLVHPSPRGAVLMGQALARAMAAAEGA